MKKEKRNAAFLQKINLTDGSNIGAPKEVHTFTTENKDGQYNFTLSNDSTKLLVTYMPSFEKYNGEKFTFTTFDSNLNLEATSSLELPFKNKKFSLENYQLDKSGNIYVVARVNKEKTEVLKKL